MTQAKIDGDVPESLDIEAAATLLVIQNYGLSVLSKSGATPEDMESAVEVLLAGLK